MAVMRAARWPAIVQLAPHGPGGVSDYLEALAARWLAGGVPTSVLRLARADVRLEPLVARLRALAGPTDAVGVVLHFSGYGYAPRGLCGWLLDELDDARRELGAQLRLLTVFHELYATGRPWTSAFWTSGVQARIATRLARRSDAIWTNSGHHGRWLGAAAGATVPVQVAPVFATIGEASGATPAPSHRPATMVVFGGTSTRQRAFDGLARWPGLLGRLGVVRIDEMGGGGASRCPGGLPRHVHHGSLPQDALAHALQSARYGLIDYPPRHLGKSTVYAAYASFGCVTVNTDSTPEPADGLQPGAHYLVDRTAPTGAVLDAVADAARRWYDGHRLEVQADGYLDLLQRIAGTGRVA